MFCCHSPTQLSLTPVVDSDTGHFSQCFWLKTWCLLRITVTRLLPDNEALLYTPHATPKQKT